MRKRVSLQRLVTLSVLSLGLLAATFGLAYAYWQAMHSLRATIGLTFQELARQSADKVSLVLDKEVEWVERLASMPEVVEAVSIGTRPTFDRPAFQRWRDTQLRYFRSMVVLDLQGRSVGGVTSATTRTHYNLQPWWSVVFQQNRPWVGELRSDDVGHGFLEVAVPIVSNGGHVIGAIKVVIENDQLFASVLRSHVGESGHVMLLNNHGQVLVCPALSPAQHRAVQVVGGSFRVAILPVGEPRWHEVLDDTHGKAGGIVGVAPVALRSPIMQADNWHILVRQDPAETFAPLTVLMRRLAAFGVLAVAIVAFLRWRLARRIVQPINALVERMRQFGQAALPKHPEAAQPVGILELDALAASFDDLAQRLARAATERERHVVELQRANRELATSEEHYRMLWNHSLHIRLLVDAEGRIQDLNRRGEIKLWRPASELLHTSFLSLFVEADRLRLRALLNEAFTTGREVVAGEVSVPAPVGEPFSMDVDLVPLDKNGEVDAVMVQLTDLTEKKHLQEQLLRSERLASLSQFASMFAHDIRNPIVGIKKTLELLSGRMESGESRLQQWYDDMRFTIDLLLGMINDMLDVYQESYSGLPLLKSTVSVRTLVDEVTHLFRTEAEAAHVAFRIDMPEGDIQLNADGRRLLRVLINLAHNALKFSPPRGTISVVVREDSSAPYGQQLHERTVHIVTIQVADEGPGIAAEDLPHLFELFFKKKDAGDIRTGRGLGLHFCRLVIEAHGGSIRAENQESGGAVFSLLLPARQEAYAGQSVDR